MSGSRPINLTPEVALLRALVEDLVYRWNDIYGPDRALLTWHNSFRDDQSTAEPKPRQLPDFSAITMVVDKVGKMVEWIHKMRNEGMRSLQTLNRVVEQIAADMVMVVACLRIKLVNSSAPSKSDGIQFGWTPSEAVSQGLRKAAAPISFREFIK